MTNLQSTKPENSPPSTAQLTEFLDAQRPKAAGDLRAAGLYGVLSGVLVIGCSALLARIVSDAIFLHQPVNAFWPLLAGLASLYILRAGLAGVAEYRAARAALKVKAALTQDIILACEARGPAGMTEEQTGEIINSTTEGLDALQGYYSRYIPAMTTTVFIPLAILAFVLPIDWISALIMLLTAPLIPVFMILIGKGAETLNQRQWRRMGYLSGHFLDVLQGLTTLKLFNASRREAKVIGDVCEQYRRDTMAVLRIAFLSSLALEFLATVSIALVAVIIGFRLLWGQIDFYHGFFVLLLAPEFYLPLRKMGSSYHSRMEAIGAAEKIAAFLASMPHVSPPAGKILLPGPRAITFEHVSFAYPGGSTILSDIHFHVAAGRQLALVGPSGGGKSTIIKLLLGFIHPTSGRILIDGVPLNDLSLENWRSHIGWVPQRATIFQGSVRENIRLGRPDALEGDIDAAAAALGIDFIERNCGEDGKGLSGGQIQRIALARALLRQSDLLLLDEPTAHLDAATESLQLPAIRSASLHRTVIMAAHRLHTVPDTAEVIVIEAGRVKAIGHDVQTANDVPEAAE